MWHIIMCINNNNNISCLEWKWTKKWKDDPKKATTILMLPFNELQKIGPAVIFVKGN